MVTRDKTNNKKFARTTLIRLHLHSPARSNKRVTILRGHRALPNVFLSARAVFFERGRVCARADDLVL